MGCSSCATGGCATPTGCGNNGSCLSGACNKLNAFDWLSNMELPGVDLFDIVEVRFKGGRKEFFKNQQKIFLEKGDPIVVEMQSGHHLGHVSLQGELVKLQMKKRKVSSKAALPIIYRKANSKDLERYEDVKKREMPTMFRTRQIIGELNLGMKLSDVEYQADNSKATFFYSADERVDFRELIKILAGEFKIRVEMRQISLRQEAGRIGGIGSCGRELCCSTWLSDFKSVSTSAARYQNLSLNPSKLSGQCGRLKCCLNYELETYQDALLDIPQVKQPLKTKKGEAKLQKVDIFRKTLWFSLENDNNWYPVEAKRVAMIQEMNKQGREPEMLMSEEMMLQEEYKNLVGTDVRRQAKTRGTKKQPFSSEGEQAEKASNTREFKGSRDSKKRRSKFVGRKSADRPKSNEAKNERSKKNPEQNKPSKKEGRRKARPRMKGKSPENPQEEAKKGGKPRDSSGKKKGGPKKHGRPVNKGNKRSPKDGNPDKDSKPPKNRPPEDQ